MDTLAAVSSRLVPLRRLGDGEVSPSSLLPSTPGIHHFISAVMEDGAGAAKGTSHSPFPSSSPIHQPRKFSMSIFGCPGKNETEGTGEVEGERGGGADCRPMAPTQHA